MTTTIAMTILEQLGGNKFLAMTGAKNVLDCGNALAFKVGRNASGITHVRVTLRDDDTYDVLFQKVRGSSVRTVAEDSMVYVGQLRWTFERRTGLATSL